MVIYEGALESLRRFKEDVSEVRTGTECGIGVKNYNDVKPGDQIEVFEKIEVKPQFIESFCVKELKSQWNLRETVLTILQSKLGSFKNK